MIRVIVLYNLPPGTDEAEFLKWRLGEHQQTNESIEGMEYTDFGRIEARWMPNDNTHTQAPHRFMTIVDFPDRETFEKSFYNPDSINELREDIKRIADPVFLISEILTSSAT